MKKYLCMHGLQCYGTHHLTNIIFQCKTKKRNMVMVTIGFWFLVYRKDVSNPRYTTLEACEHVYGRHCMGKCAFIVIEMMHLEEI